MNESKTNSTDVKYFFNYAVVNLKDELVVIKASKSGEDGIEILLKIGNTELKKVITVPSGLQTILEPGLKPVLKFVFESLFVKGGSVTEGDIQTFILGTYPSK